MPSQDMETPRCGAKLRQRDGTCRLPAGWGTDHPGHGNCRKHLGNTANGRKHGLTEQARAELARLDLPPVEDPLSELAAVTRQVLAWKDAWAAKVNALSSVRYETEGGEQLRAEIAVWERALDRCERFLTAMARLNIDERLARITETRATAIIIVFTAALDAAGIEGPQREAVLAAADEEFARQAGIALLGGTPVLKVVRDPFQRGDSPRIGAQVHP
jgi:hypothetical protein